MTSAAPIPDDTLALLLSLEVSRRADPTWPLLENDQGRYHALAAEHAASIAAELLAARAKIKEMEWRPIESAPENTPLLLACGGVLVGHLDRNYGLFLDTERRVCRPTAYMLAPELPPLPSPPSPGTI